MKQSESPRNEKADLAKLHHEVPAVGMSAFFTDPVLRAPTLGSMLMCVAASLVGVIVVLRKRSLIGETLSHASYPGVVLSVIIASMLFGYSDETISIAILLGAFFFSVLGLLAVETMERKLQVKSDAALCFVLSTFLGVGILMASRIQITHAIWYRQIQVFLYGQAATMTDMHIWIYGALAFLTIGFIFLLFPQIKLIAFDRLFAATIGLKGKTVDAFSFILLVLAIVIGIRSVGVVMMSGMLIAPAVAARQFSDRLSQVFFLAGIFGALSGFLGIYLSVEIPVWLAKEGRNFYLPTGPMIILVAGFICFSSLLFAPKRGVLFRGIRILRFNYQCLRENVLKNLWKFGPQKPMLTADLRQTLSAPLWLFTILLFQLKGQRFVRSQNGRISLTGDGEKKARRIVRLHRLWEVYLFTYLGMDVEKVHASAEEMEHILTKDLEEKLTLLLHDPKKDPHHQPIPETGRWL
ncbi:MAG: iron chelate uptake ABC transporter family permease subunit [Simkaniaceae bacterium]